MVALQPGSKHPQLSWEEVAPAVMDSLSMLLELAEKSRITLALELHIDSPSETLAQASWLFEHLEDIRVVYDPSHFLMRGVDLESTASLFDKVSAVHLRDAAPGKIQVPFGHGQLDLSWVMKMLSSIGYSGVVTIEYIQNEEFDALRSALQLADALDSIMKQR